MTASGLLLAAAFCVWAGATAGACGAQQTVPTQINGQSAPGQTGALATGSAELSRLNADALGWLQQLLRFNTTNPPGNELAEAKYIADILQKEGIQSETFESAPGRGILVARLQASAMPDPSKALLLMAHLDVVGVDKAKWTQDPFGATIKDGYLYGRGAVDDKGMLAVNLAVFVALKRAGVRLNRDVIFLAESDEEAGGANGITFAVEKHWDKIAAGFALNEGGGVAEKNGKAQYVGVQASEKVSLSVDVTATGTSGHASIPRKDDPVAHLVTAMAKIATYEAPVEFNSVTRAYFAGLAPLQDEETSKWMRALETPDRGDHAARVIASANPYWNAIMRDTIAETMLQAGIRANVVPGDAKGVLNIRLLPGNMGSVLISKLSALVNDPAVKFEIEPNAGEAAPSSSLESDLYRSIARVAAKEFPGAPVVPAMSPWATDSSKLRMRSVQAYGLVPFPLTDEDLNRMHGNDERIPIASFQKGIGFEYGVVTDFVAAK